MVERTQARDLLFGMAVLCYAVVNVDSFHFLSPVLLVPFQLLTVRQLSFS